MFDKHALALAINKTLDGDYAVCDEPMAEHTTFRIGGNAAVFVQPTDGESVAQILHLCKLAGAPVRFLGCGSDLLVSDDGLDCVVVHIGEAMSQIIVDGERLEVQAGATNRDVAEAACRAGLSGYEFASGIPGTVGGAAIMNAGAYGGEFKDVCEYVGCILPTGEYARYTAEDAQWAYRSSVFDKDGCAIIEVRLKLKHDDEGAIRARMDDLQKRREEKQPLDLPSAGSTFKRPEGHFAGKLIQDAGLRGFMVGGAQVSEKHTGFVVNAGHATAQDVRSLIAHVREEVDRQFGVKLEPEVRMWGFGE